MMRGDYPDSGQDGEDFRAGATVAVEFQLHSWNFKETKRGDATKAAGLEVGVAGSEVDGAGWKVNGARSKVDGAGSGQT